jgi:hypothetical protein
MPRAAPRSWIGKIAVITEIVDGSISAAPQP